MGPAHDRLLLSGDWCGALVVSSGAVSTGNSAEWAKRRGVLSLELVLWWLVKLVAMGRGFLEWAEKESGGLYGMEVSLGEENAPCPILEKWKSHMS